MTSFFYEVGNSSFLEHQPLDNDNDYEDEDKNCGNPIPWGLMGIDPRHFLYVQ